MVISERYTKCAPLAYTYGGVLGGFGVSALKCDTVALVLEALGSDEALDTGSLGVRLLALTLGLDFAADNELADLVKRFNQTRSIQR